MTYNEHSKLAGVAICTGRVEAKKNDRRSKNWSAVAICTGRVEAKPTPGLSDAAKGRCNLHGACGGKAAPHQSILPL